MYIFLCTIIQSHLVTENSFIMKSSIMCVGRNVLIVMSGNVVGWSVSDSKVLSCRETIMVCVQHTYLVWWWKWWKALWSLRWRRWRWRWQWRWWLLLWRWLQLSSLPGKSGARANLYRPKSCQQTKCLQKTTSPQQHSHSEASWVTIGEVKNIIMNLTMINDHVIADSSGPLAMTMIMLLIIQ